MLKGMIAAAAIFVFFYKFDGMKDLSQSIAHCVAIHRH